MRTAQPTTTTTDCRVNGPGVNSWYSTNRLHIDACGVIGLDPFHSRCKQTFLTNQGWRDAPPLDVGRLPATACKQPFLTNQSLRDAPPLDVGRLPAYSRSRQLARTLRGQINVDGKANTDNVGTMSTIPSKL